MADPQCTCERVSVDAVAHQNLVVLIARLASELRHFGGRLADQLRHVLEDVLDVLRVRQIIRAGATGGRSGKITPRESAPCPVES